MNLWKVKARVARSGLISLEKGIGKIADAGLLTEADRRFAGSFIRDVRDYLTDLEADVLRLRRLVARRR